MVSRLLRRPLTRLLAAAVVLAVLVSLYYPIAWFTEGRSPVVPEIALDRTITLQPAWMLVYGSIWVFMLLPFAVVRHDGLVLRLLLSYIMVVGVACAGFLAWPTIGPRPDSVSADGFFAWALRLNYALDPPYNCFPSLHVAWAFVSALTCWRVHRGVGLAAVLWSSLIGISTLFTKQHYVLDVVAGVLVAGAAYLLILRPFPRISIADQERRRAPARARWVVAAYGVFLTGSALAYWGILRPHG